MPHDRTATHSDLIKAGVARARRRRRLKIVHAERYPEILAEPLRPIIASRAAELRQIVEDLGGEEHVSAAQLALARQWAQLSVVREAAFLVFARDGNPTARAAERLVSVANAERNALLALGLERRAKPVESLAHYLARNREEAAQDRPGSTINDLDSGG